MPVRIIQNERLKLLATFKAVFSERTPEGMVPTEKAPELSLVIRRLERNYAVRKLESGEIDVVISVN